MVRNGSFIGKHRFCVANNFVFLFIRHTVFVAVKGNRRGGIFQFFGMGCGGDKKNGIMPCGVLFFGRIARKWLVVGCLLYFFF